MVQTRLPLLLQGTAEEPVRTPLEDFRLGQGALVASGADVAHRRGGIFPGTQQAAPTFTTGQITLAPFQAHVPGTAAAAQGGYTVTCTTPTSYEPTPPAAGLFRKGRVVAKVYDGLYVGDGGQFGWDTFLVEGDPAATVAAAVLPALPQSAISLLDFSVTSGGAVAQVGVQQFTTSNGGVLPLMNGDTAGGSYVNQLAYDSVLGLRRWSGAAWAAPVFDAIALTNNRTFVIHTGPGAAPANPVEGTEFRNLGLLCTFRFTGGVWRQADVPIVANTAARTAMNTDVMIYDGFTVWQSDTDVAWTWNGSTWTRQSTWVQITQAAYDALAVKDPAILYVVVG